MIIKVLLFILFIALILGGVGLTIFFFYKHTRLKDEVIDIARDVEECKRYGATDEKKAKLQENLDKFKKLLHKSLSRIIVGIVVTIAMIAATILIPGNIHQVNTGEVAVVRNLGKVEGTRDPGVYWDFYMVKKYEFYDTKVREINIETQTYSKDNQIIGVVADLQYTIDSAQVDKIATEYGTIEKLESKITSIALDNIKSVFAQNTATDVINNRSEISANISRTVDESINVGYYVNVKTIVLTNIDFTDDFEAAVAAKVAQEQKKQQALIEQEQQLAEAENNKKIAIANAQAEAQAATTKANAEAEVARIKAQADQDVAKIEADTALYAGQKAAAIAIQKLASINGWTVITTTEANGDQYTKLYKPDQTLVTAEELAIGTNKLLEVYKYEKWDGKLPVYQMGDNGVITVVDPTNN